MGNEFLSLVCGGDSIICWEMHLLGLAYVCKYRCKKMSVWEKAPSCSPWKGTICTALVLMKFLISAVLAYTGHSHIHVSKNYPLEGNPRVSHLSHFMSCRDFFQRKVYQTFQAFHHLEQSLIGLLSTHCHCWQWVFRAKPDQLERRGWKEGREKSYCGRTDVFLSPLDSFFITSLNFKAFWHAACGRFSWESREAMRVNGAINLNCPLWNQTWTLEICIFNRMLMLVWLECPSQMHFIWGGCC